MTLASAGSIDPTQLGVASVTVLMLMAAVVALWRQLLAERKQARDDQERAITELAETRTVVAEFTRLAQRMLERDLLRRDRGDPI